MSKDIEEVLLWSDKDIDSEMSRKMRLAKQINDKTFWSTAREVIDHDLNTLPKTSFRTWASLVLIPIVNNWGRMHKPIVNAIANGLEDNKIRHILQEEWIGVPDEFLSSYRVFEDSNYSSHRCYNVNHLINYDKYNELDKIVEYDTIVEIGGGYGDMCAIIHKYGFKGKYYIFDFPEIHRLQRYFLTASGVRDVNFVSDVSDLPSTVDLTIGTWSISEIELDLRNQVVDKLWDSQHWLISYQNRIFGVDNHQYFSKKFSDKDFVIDPIEYMPYDGGNNYLIV